jgi:PAS domain S-box-containing protein
LFKPFLAAHRAIVDIREEQLQLLFGSQIFATVMIFAINALFLATLRNVIPLSTLIIWSVCSMSAAVARLWYSYRFQKNFRIGEEIWPLASPYLVILGLQTLTLAAVPIFLFPTSDFVLQLLVVMVMIGVAAGGSITLAPYLPAALTFSSAILLPLVYRLSTDAIYPAYFPFILILFIGFLASTSRLHNRFVLRTIDLQRENLTHTEFRNSAQRQIRESEKQLGLITDSIPALVTYIDKDLRFRYVNKGVEEAFDMTAEKFEGKLVSEIIGEDDFAKVRTDFERALSGQAVNIEVTRDYPVTGRTVGRLELVPDLDDDGNVRGLFSLMTDITEQKLAEVKLRDSEARFSTAFDANPSMMAIIRLRDRMLLNVNRQWSEDMGFKARDVLNKPIDDLNVWLSENDRWRTTESMQKTTSLRNIETSFRTGYGTIIDAELNIERIMIANEPHLLILANDVTSRNKLNRELLASKEEVEAASRAKSDFLASMSHELRTPLNAIIGFSDFLGRDFAGPMNDRQREYVRDIQRSGDHLLALINDVLDISKIEAGKEDINNDRIQIRELLDNATALVRDNVARKNIELKTEIDPGCPDIIADQRLMMQIMINLLSNAVKFTNVDGEVAVSADLVIEGETATGLRFVVRDNGIGIRAEDIPKALAKFEQVEDVFDRQFEGTGLGLPLVVALTELQGGTFDLQSEYGEGTCVTVTLPRERIVNARA